jgi:hypothetical protein
MIPIRYHREKKLVLYMASMALREYPSLDFGPTDFEQEGGIHL